MHEHHTISHLGCFFIKGTWGADEKEQIESNETTGHKLLGQKQKTVEQVIKKVHSNVIFCPWNPSNSHPKQVLLPVLCTRKVSDINLNLRCLVAGLLLF